MSKSRKSYIRAGDYMEVRVSKNASYSQVVTRAVEVLGVEEEEDDKGEGEPSIFRIDGTVVPDSTINELSWTISRYLQSLHKTPGQIKLGIGYHYWVCVCQFLANIMSRILVFAQLSEKVFICMLLFVLFIICAMHSQHKEHQCKITGLIYPYLLL